MTIKFKDADDVTREAASAGAGTALDPYIPVHSHSVADGDDEAQGAIADAAAAQGGTGTISAKLRRLSTDLATVLGYIDTLETLFAGGLPAALTAGGGLKVGNVDSLPAGDANIGNVDIATVPADPFGNNADLAAVAGAAGSIQAKLRRLTADLGSVLTAVDGLETLLGGGLPSALTGSGGLKVGNVDALPAGSARIGKATIRNSADSADIDPLAETTFTGRLGEVAASPTANTVLARLKDLLTGIMLAGGNVAHDAVDSGNPVKVGGKAYAPDSGPADVASADRADLFTDLKGRLLVYLATKLDTANDAVVAKLATDAIQDGATALTPKFAIIDAASSGDNTLVAAVASKKIRVLSLFLMAAGAVTVRFESGAAGTALTGQMNVPANGGFTLPFNPLGHFETAVNTLLNLELSGAVSVDGCLTYCEVA